MPSTLYSGFLGYKATANPPFNSAQSGKNFVIHRHRDTQNPALGWIEQADGYAKKVFVTGGSNPGTLPANDTVIRKISSISHKDIYNLYIPEHGGQNVTIVAATYRKTGYYSGSPTLDRFGIWIRPYWSGAAWVDEWRELTEMYIFTLKRIGSSNNDRLYIDDGTYVFKTIDPAGIVFGADYFKNWTIVYDTFGDAENYDLIIGSGYVGEFADDYSFKLAHLNTDFSTRTVGTKLLVYRSFLTQELPSTLTSFIYGILSEARLTSGNSATDLVLGVASKTASFIHGGSLAYTRTVDAVIAQPGTLSVWQYAAMLGIAGVESATGADILDAGTYYLKKSIVMDDGSETSLADCVTATAGVWSAGNSIVVGASQKIGVYIFRSPGALPIRARYLRVYMSDDNVTFYNVKDYDLRDATLWDGAGLHGSALLGGDHWYAAAPYSAGSPVTPTTIFITGLDWADDSGAEAMAQIGRAITDSGVIQFKAAAVVGNTCFAIGVRAGGTLYPNYIFASLQTGDGSPQYDVFGLVANNMLRLEYNDGDELIGVYPAGDRLLAFKHRSVMLVSQGSTGDVIVFLADAITKADGLCSLHTIAGFEDVVYWAGYSGIYSFSSQGIRLLNNDWITEWRAVSAANKEAAVAVFDRTNRQYRIAYAGIERMLDVDTGEWVLGDPADQPTKFAANQRDGTVDFLSGTLIQTLGLGTRHDGVNFTTTYQFNDLLAAEQGGVNALLIDIKLRYASSVAISAQLYKDGSASGSAFTLPAAATEYIIRAPLSFRPKRIGLALTWTTTADAQSTQIKEVNPHYQIIPGGVTNST